MDVQRVTMIGIGQGGAPEDANSRMEAIELRRGPGAHIDPDVVARISAELHLTAHIYEDRRRRVNWGASGLEGQDIEILYLIAVGAQLTAAALIEIVGRSFGALTGPRVDDAAAAWKLFDEFISRAFKLEDAKLVEAKRIGDVWHITAEAHRHRYEGRISEGGHVVDARKA